MMRWLAYIFAVLAAAALPWMFVYFTSLTVAYGDLLSLLRLYLMTCAFVGALWAVYLKEPRLRAHSDNVLVSLIVFVIATIVLFIPLLFMHFIPVDDATTEHTSITTVGASTSMPSNGTSTSAGTAGVQNTLLSNATRFTTFLSIEVLLGAFVTLLLTVFLQTYNQLYNLRTNKFIKYFKPVNYVRTWFTGHKSYEFEMIPRHFPPDTPELLTFLTERERASIEGGGISILLRGAINRQVMDRVLAWLLERLDANETLTYIVADRHPHEIWSWMKAARLADHRGDIVFVDAYTPSFGFTDDIHTWNETSIRDEGVAYVKAKTFAGVHTANNRAFNLIKWTENERNVNKRRPMTAVYAHLSALTDFESLEQFRVFWRHVVPSERSYKMLTLIIEHDLAGAGIIDFVRQLVDVELIAKLTDGTVSIVRDGAHEHDGGDVVTR